MNPIEIIKKKRIKKGLTQKELSDYLKLPKNGWQKIESGNQCLKLDDFLKIIEFLNIPLTAFSQEEIFIITKNDLFELTKNVNNIKKITDKIVDDNLKYSTIININENSGTIHIGDDKK